MSFANNYVNCSTSQNPKHHSHISPETLLPSHALPLGGDTGGPQDDPLTREKLSNQSCCHLVKCIEVVVGLIKINA